jgi:hypothetical protein
MMEADIGVSPGAAKRGLEGFVGHDLEALVVNRDFAGPLRATITF